MLKYKVEDCRYVILNTIRRGNHTLRANLHWEIDWYRIGVWIRRGVFRNIKEGKIWVRTMID